MIRHSRNASLKRPSHRSRPTLDRMEDRLQPNILLGLWDDLALGLPTVARPRPPEVASNREHHARVGQAHHGRPPSPHPTRPIPARAPRLTPLSEPPLPTWIGPAPGVTAVAVAWSPNLPSVASPARLPMSPTT